MLPARGEARLEPWPSLATDKRMSGHVHLLTDEKEKCGSLKAARNGK